jgi:hypothetical protein
MKRVLLSLWLVGAAVYAASTLLWTNTVILDGETASTPVITGSGPKAAADAPRTEPKAEKPIASPGNSHAFSLDDPPSEVVAAGPEQPAIVEEGQAPKAKPPAEAMPPEEAGQGELLRVVTAASIHSLPSNSADVIGSAQAGAELRARSHESGWVQFVDPDSGHSGWIDSVFLEPVTHTAEKTEPTTAPPAQDQSVAEEEATDTPPPEDQQSESVAEGETHAPPAGRKLPKSRMEDEPKPPAHVAAQDSPSAKPQKRRVRAIEQTEQAPNEQAAKKPTGTVRALREQASNQEEASPPPPQSRRGRDYVELPADEELLPPRRRFGLFGRRRMMMMEDLPPQAPPEDFPPAPHYWQ